MKQIMRATLVALGIVALSACTLFGGPAAQPAASLDAEWRLVNGTHGGNAIPLVPGSDITLRVDGTEVGGRSGCNLYGGTLEVDGARIIINAVYMTEMACGEDVMAAESAYLAALGGVDSATRNGEALTLSGEGTELRFVLVPPVPDADLVGTAWILDSLISGEAVSSVLGDPAGLSLAADGTFTGSTGCRGFGGSYTIVGSEVRVTNLVADTRGCPDNLAAQDEQVLGVLGDGFTVSIDGDTLTLTAAGGLGLGYRAAAGE
jgi:heat shock protein HslJ